MGMMVCAHKFGIIYCKDGQISEDEMLNNGAAFPSLSLLQALRRPGDGAATAMLTKLVCVAMWT
jgi:hypothetical protein